MTALLAACFAACAVGFLALGVFALTQWRNRTLGLLLPLACLLQAVWAGAVLVNGVWILLPTSVLVGLDLVRGLAWIALLGGSLLLGISRSTRRWLVVGVTALALALIFVLLVRTAATLVLRLELQRWGGLLTSIAGLVVVEQFARNAREDARWHLKHIWLGTGLLFATELAVWSTTLLLGRIDPLLWVFRGVMNLLVAGLLGLALYRLRNFGGEPFRSERVFFFNTTLALTGLYVLLMSAASWWLTSGRTIAFPLVAAVFSALAVASLAVAVFSDQFRAWLRVTLAKRLARYGYDYRDEWLKLTAALAESSDVPVHDRATRVMASFVNSGFGALWVRDEDGSYGRASSNLPFSAPSRVPDDPFFVELGELTWIHDLDEDRTVGGAPRARHQRGPQHPAPAWLVEQTTAWLVVPLVRDVGLAGFLVIGQPMTPTPLGWEQRDLLRVAARQVAGYIALEKAAAKLAEMHQFEALNRLSAFVMHDLRHLVAQLALVVKNAARHRHNPEFIDDAIVTIESSVQRMNALMETLRQGEVTEQERRVDIAGLLREVVLRTSRGSPVPVLEVQQEPGEVMAVRERLLQALEHLVRNAQDATPADGNITLKVGRASQRVEIEIADTGAGMDPEFARTRLFKPFESTKGEQGMGLGAYEARDIVRKLGGDILVDTAPGQGCRMRVLLPPAPALVT